MKKTAFIIKTVAAGLMFALGLTVFILGLSGETGILYGYSSIYEGDYQTPSYEFYGGDAYTGIQNAAVDTARNVAQAAYDLSNSVSRLQNAIAYQMENIYIWAGVILMIVGIYLVGCALSTIEPKAKKVQNYTPNDYTPNNF